MFWLKRQRCAGLLVFVELIGSAKCEITFQVVIIKYQRNSIITGPTVYISIFHSFKPQKLTTAVLNALLLGTCDFLLQNE